MAKNNKTRFFYVLYSDKTRVFDQSERAYYPIYIINIYIYIYILIIKITISSIVIGLKNAYFIFSLTTATVIFHLENRVIVLLHNVCGRISSAVLQLS